MATPSYIPSFSSIRDPYFVDKILGTLKPEYPHGAFLISAFDYKTKAFDPRRLEVIDRIQQFSRNHVLYLDSGSYELQNLNGNAGMGEWDTQSVFTVATALNPDVVVCYDEAPAKDQVAKLDERLRADVEGVVDLTEDLQSRYAMTFIMRSTPVTNPLESVPGVVKVLKDNLDSVSIIAFPDVDMGADIVRRCQFAYRLRLEMEEEDVVMPIHVFGCSEPLSMVLYSLAGVDLFDGAGWWERVLDSENLTFHDSSYLRLADCPCRVCSKTDWSNTNDYAYGSVLMWHNLLQQLNLLAKIGHAINENGFEKLCSVSKLGLNAYRTLRSYMED